MEHPALENVAVILVEPQTPGNIGMICRAMANFGLVDLRLVNPCEHLHPEARKFAVFAQDLLEGARIYPDLPSAVADLPVAAATTRRTGNLRGAPLDPAALSRLHAALPPGERLGIVFGREDAGLTSEEVACCTHTVTIRTTARQGSLNIAQAVLICLYELSLERELPPPQPESAPVSAGELEPLLTDMEHVLTRIAFLNPARPEQELTPLRRIYQRAALTKRELGMVRSMWTQIAWSVRDWRGRRRGQLSGEDENPPS